MCTLDHIALVLCPKHPLSPTPPKLHGTNMIQLHPQGKITFCSIVVGELLIEGIMTGNNSVLKASVCGVRYEEGPRERGKLYLVLTGISCL